MDAPGLGSCFALTMMALVFTGAFWCLAHAAKGDDGEQFQSSPRCWASAAGEGRGGEDWGQRGLRLGEDPAGSLASTL